MASLCATPASIGWPDIFLLNCLFCLSCVQLLRKQTDFDKTWYTAPFKSHLELDL